MTVGILALQGDVREHGLALDAVGERWRPVRRPEDLEMVDALVLPGGESTTMAMLLESSGLFDPVARALAGGFPAFGTCAGLVLLARSVLDGRSDQATFGALDCTVRRNGYGRQLDSFETVIEASRLSAELGVADAPLPAVFIRAPVVVDAGGVVEVLAGLARPGDLVPTPVVCRQGNILATTFHPELTPDRRLHQLFAAMVRRARTRAQDRGAPTTFR